MDALVTVIEEMESPFEEDGQDLLRLHSKDIMDKQSVECLKEREKVVSNICG